MPTVGIEPTISAGERPKTYARPLGPADTMLIHTMTHFKFKLHLKFR
jgi:hypothetical protein